MDIFDGLSALGGLCLFLFGMQIMAEALQRRAGGRLEGLLRRMTRSRWAGFFTGLAVTAAVQSSSAAMVMVVGFVNSGLLTLGQAVGVIMGTNVGTTVTPWLLSLGGLEGGGVLGRLLRPAGFGSYSVTTAEKHDEMIAFTSQMAHLVSNAYIKSPTARAHKGFSAGSYKDMTRVAWLNAPMWSELFLENRDNMLHELDCLMDRLMEYRAAIAEDDAAALTQLLEDGKKRKEEVDGR